MIRWAIKHSLYVAALGFGGMVAWAVSRPTVEGSGNSVTEERSIGPVSEVTLSGVGDVVIKQGDVASLRVTADDNILPLLVSESNGNKLRLSTRSSSMRPKTKIAYVVTVPQLDALTVSGAGNVTVEKLTGDDLKVKLSGAGTATLREVTYKELALDLSGAGKATATGTATRTTFKLSGAGKIDATGLQAVSADVRVSGAGHANVWAARELKANVSGAGGVKYKGTPQLEQKVSGAGSVRPLE
ncbi:DUF2807 domain-containing protein [Gemmata sp. G18]|uniref:DUF2807 domain-containing protein n=1 Tax=Gemmata palustris TaxID=2822762 RepID=A0ABS5C291_9BACT|nr:head GIN domain-containing protein [Gemmata palustris]MBP3960107.1 DUF2807 domain-containing protein [Gemmata palustris]